MDLVLYSQVLAVGELSPLNFAKMESKCSAKIFQTFIEGHSEFSQNIKQGAFCKNNSRLKTGNYFRKELSLNCLTVF